MVFGRNASAWYGWVIFAGSLLVMLGTFNIIYGIFALVENEVLVPTRDELVAVDLTGWGVFLVVFGGLLALTGVGLFTANKVARWAAIVLAGLNAVWQLWSLEAYPVWSLMLVAIDVVVIYALTAHWFEVRQTVGEDVSTPPRRATVG